MGAVDTLDAYAVEAIAGHEEGSFVGVVHELGQVWVRYLAQFQASLHEATKLKQLETQPVTAGLSFSGDETDLFKAAEEAVHGTLTHAQALAQIGQGKGIGGTKFLKQSHSLVYNKHLVLWALVSVHHLPPPLLFQNMV